MSQAKRKNEELFKASHLSRNESAPHSFGADWQSNVMAEVRKAAQVEMTNRDADAPLQVFAFRVGWAALGVAFAASMLCLAIGTSLASKGTGSEPSLWTIIDRDSTYGMNQFNTDGKRESEDLK